MSWRHENQNQTGNILLARFACGMRLVVMGRRSLATLAGWQGVWNIPPDHRFISMLLRVRGSRGLLRMGEAMTTLHFTSVALALLTIIAWRFA